MQVKLLKETDFIEVENVAERIINSNTSTCTISNNLESGFSFSSTNPQFSRSTNFPQVDGSHSPHKSEKTPTVFQCETCHKKFDDQELFRA